MENVIKLYNQDDNKIYLYKGYYDKKQSQELFDYALEKFDTKIYPFRLRQQRALWACGDEKTKHEFRGVEVKINPWDAKCAKLQQSLMENFGVYNNFCLVNHYRNGKDSIAPHSDGELYSKNKSVFTLSTGATRKMQLIPYNQIKHKKLEFDVEAGDLFLMCGNTQTIYKHGIEPQPSIKEPRISFTLRSTKLH